MKFKSEIVTQASGSVGGVTYAHTAGMLYRRARSIPVNPNTTDQQAVRAIMTALSLRFSQTLTDAQRTAWANYADLTEITNVFGDPLKLSAQQMYIRCNAVRQRAGIAIVDAGPTQPGLIALSTPVLTASIASGNLSIAYTNTDDWAGETGGGLNIQTSRFLSPARNFFRGPYRYLDTVEGSGTPPTSPETSANNAFGQAMSGATEGQKIAMRYIAFEADGRISAVQTEIVTVEA